jgi:hypothetical protein
MGPRGDCVEAGDAEDSGLALAYGVNSRWLLLWSLNKITLDWF